MWVYQGRTQGGSTGSTCSPPEERGASRGREEKKEKKGRKRKKKGEKRKKKEKEKKKKKCRKGNIGYIGKGKGGLKIDKSIKVY